MNPVEENINLLIAELKRNHKADKEQCLDYLGHVFRTITTNNIPLDQRHGASMTVNAFLIKARGNDLRYAEGFFGNWAKQLQEKKDVDDFDVDDAGC
jgi:hypothetical protein